MLRAGLLWAFKRTLGIYFREVEIVGEVPPKSTGGRIFAANHVNGLVDPVLVMTSTEAALSPVAKSTLWKIPLLRALLDAMLAVPIVRRKDDPNKSQAANDAVFERVAKHLGDGGNILIFPEGTSHNEPQLVPLKSGAGRMLAAAKSAGARGLTFQAVGLEFDARDVFRSRALILYGPVRAVDAIEGDVAAAITSTLREDLSELIVEGATWDERVLIARVAEMLANDAGDATLAGWNAIGRRIEEARAALRASGRVEPIAHAMTRYHALLDAAGLDDATVARGEAHASEGRALRTLAYGVAWPLAVVGTIAYFLPYQLPRLASRLAKGEADSVSTYKLGTGILVFPAWALALVIASLVLVPWPWGLAAAALAVVSPFAALAWLDRRDRARARVGPASAAPALDAVRAARAEVRDLVEKTRRDLGLSSAS